MRTVQEMNALWKKVLDEVRQKFPIYYKMLQEKGWKASVEERKGRNLGRCYHFQKKVTVNITNLGAATFDSIRDTMLHEIAHAIDFEKRGTSDHSRHWKAIAQEIGANPSATSKGKVLGRKYKYVCVYKDTNEKWHFVRGYDRKPNREPIGKHLLGMYVRNKKSETLDRLINYTWETWCGIVGLSGKPPYEEYWK